MPPSDLAAAATRVLRTDTTAVLFLARGVDNGRAAAEAFFQSYRSHPAGHPHSLVVLTKGWDGQPGLEDVIRWTASLGGQALALPDDGFDFAAYFRAVPQLTQHWVCLLNTNSRICADNWLARLVVASAKAGVGAVGATGSWESSLRTVRSSWPQGGLLRTGWHAARVGFNFLRFPEFPNPHLRSNAMLMRRSLFAEFAAARRVPRAKRDAQALESGRRGLSAFVRSRGLELVVAGADGRTFPAEKWPGSGTFRIHGHPNLLVSDNQTRGFDAANSATQCSLQLAAWGRVLARPEVSCSGIGQSEPAAVPK